MSDDQSAERIRRETYRSPGDESDDVQQPLPVEPDPASDQARPAVTTTGAVDAVDDVAGVDGVHAEPQTPVSDEGPAHRADLGDDEPAPNADPGSTGDVAVGSVATDHPVATDSPVVTDHLVGAAPGGVTPSASANSGAHRADAVTTTTPPVQAEPEPAAAVVAAAVAPAPVAHAAEPAPRAEEPRTIYVDAPAPPKKKGNRGLGSLFALIATLLFALVWAAASALVIAIATPPDSFGDSFTNFIISAAFWVPIIAFLVGMLLIVVLFNRAGWWLYILGGLLVAAVVYGGYLLGAVITVAQQLTAEEVPNFIARIALSPLAIAAGIVGREVSIWTGAAVAARGRRVKAKNAEAHAEYERVSAERKAEYERARAGTA